jgi:hypothetical protein
MSETQVEERTESWVDSYAQLQQSVKQLAQVAKTYDGLLGKELKRDLKKLTSFKPSRWFGFFFESYDFCMGFHLPFRIIPDARYLIKIGSKSGILIIRLFWFTLSVRW